MKMYFSRCHAKKPNNILIQKFNKFFSLKSFFFKVIFLKLKSHLTDEKKERKKFGCLTPFCEQSFFACCHIISFLDFGVWKIAVWLHRQIRDKLYASAFLVAQTVKNLSAMRKTWIRFLGREYPLEKGMATHSSILAWKIPWTEEPGGL